MPSCSALLVLLQVGVLAGGGGRRGGGALVVGFCKTNLIEFDEKKKLCKVLTAEGLSTGLIFQVEHFTPLKYDIYIIGLKHVTVFAYTLANLQECWKPVVIAAICI